MLLISKSYLRFLSFVIICFILCYALSFFFPQYFIGTDKGYYLLLLEKNINFSRITFADKDLFTSTEPLYFIISRIFSIFNNPTFSLECLRVISLISKAIFFSILLFKSKKKYIFAILTSILYFLVFYNRSEIGSLRNCYAVNIFQFIIFFNNTIRSYLLTLLVSMFHMHTAISALPYLSLLSLKSLTVQSPINKFKNFIKTFLNLKINIPSILKMKFVYILILFIGFLVIPLMTKPFYIDYLLKFFIKGEISYQFRTLNPFTYYRFYIHLFTLIGVFITYYNKIPIKFPYSKFNISVENNIYLIFSYTSILFILSFAPLANLVHRTSYISMYLCFILCIYHISMNYQSLYKIKLKYLISFISFLITIALITGSTYKYFNRQGYNNKIDMQMEAYE